MGTTSRSRRTLIALALASSLAACSDDSQHTEAPRARSSEGTETMPEPAPSSDPSPEPVSALAADVIELVPGERIGDVRLGMTRAEVQALATLAPHPQFSAMTIPITAYYREERVSAAEVSLAHADRDVRVGDVVIPRDASIERIRELLDDCEAPDVREGGTFHVCRGGELQIAIGSGAPGEIWLRTGPRP